MRKLSEILPATLCNSHSPEATRTRRKENFVERQYGRAPDSPTRYSVGLSSFSLTAYSTQNTSVLRWTKEATDRSHISSCLEKNAGLLASPPAPYDGSLDDDSQTAVYIDFDISCGRKEPLRSPEAHKIFGKKPDVLSKVSENLCNSQPVLSSTNMDKSDDKKCLTPPCEGLFEKSTPALPSFPVLYTGPSVVCEQSTITNDPSEYRIARERTTKLSCISVSNNSTFSELEKDNGEISQFQPKIRSRLLSRISRGYNVDSRLGTVSDGGAYVQRAMRGCLVSSPRNLPDEPFTFKHRVEDNKTSAFSTEPETSLITINAPHLRDLEAAMPLTFSQPSAPTVPSSDDRLDFKYDMSTQHFTELRPRNNVNTSTFSSDAMNDMKRYECTCESLECRETKKQCSTESAFLEDIHPKEVSVEADGAQTMALLPGVPHRPSAMPTTDASLVWGSYNNDQHFVEAEKQPLLCKYGETVGESESEKSLICEVHDLLSKTQEAQKRNVMKESDLSSNTESRDTLNHSFVFNKRIVEPQTHPNVTSFYTLPTIPPSNMELNFLWSKEYETVTRTQAKSPASPQLNQFVERGNVSPPDTYHPTGGSFIPNRTRHIITQHSLPTSSSSSSRSSRSLDATTSTGPTVSQASMWYPNSDSSNITDPPRAVCCSDGISSPGSSNQQEHPYMGDTLEHSQRDSATYVSDDTSQLAHLALTVERNIQGQIDKNSSLSSIPMWPSTHVQRDSWTTIESHLHNQNHSEQLSSGEGIPQPTLHQKPLEAENMVDGSFAKHFSHQENVEHKEARAIGEEQEIYSAADIPTYVYNYERRNLDGSGKCGDLPQGTPCLLSGLEIPNHEVAWTSNSFSIERDGEHDDQSKSNNHMTFQQFNLANGSHIPLISYDLNSSFIDKENSVADTENSTCRRVASLPPFQMGEQGDDECRFSVVTHEPYGNVDQLRQQYPSSCITHAANAQISKPSAISEGNVGDQLLSVARREECAAQHQYDSAAFGLGHHYQTSESHPRRHHYSRQDGRSISRRKLIRPSRILCYQLRQVMPIVLRQFESSTVSRKSLCRQLTGQLYPNNPKPSPNFLLNTLLPVFRAANTLGFNWSFHLTSSLSYLRLWICSQRGGKELIQQYRVEYNAPTGKEYRPVAVVDSLHLEGQPDYKDDQWLMCY